MNFNCVMCDKEFAKSNLYDFDEEMETGICEKCFKPILPHQEKRIRNAGLPDQIKKMEDKLLIQNKNKKMFVPQEIYKNLGNPIATEQKKDWRPKEITYEKCAALFWYYYKSIVKFETGKLIEASDLDGNTKDVIANYIKYLIGFKNEMFDTKKSIYLWGSYGVGKSTIILSGQRLMEHINTTTRWNDRNYNIASLSEMFFTARNNSDLKAYDNIAHGNYALDEMKADQFQLKYYGSNVSIMPSLFEMRHNKWKSRGHRTIITSNVAPSELRELVNNDDVLLSRIKQEYTSIELIGKNKR